MLAEQSRAEQSRAEQSRAERLDYVDYLRCFGILLMIMGHVSFGSLFDTWIHAFHMPMWFFISGYFCKPSQDFKSHVIKRVKTILVPYICFGVGYVVLYGLIWKQWNWIQLLFPNSNTIELNGALWFLPALFFSDLVAFTVLKYVKNYASWIILAAIGIFGSLALIKLPLSMDSALVGVGFYLIGYIVKNKLKVLINLNVFISIGVFILFSILAIVNGSVNMRTNTYSNVVLYWLVATGMIIALFNIFRVVFQKGNLKIIKKIGQDSIIYVCMNQFVMRLINHFIPTAGMGNVLLLVVRVGVVLAIMVICYLINEVISKTPLKVVLGK